MDLPIVEQIAQNIEETLSGVTKVAGFHNDLHVERLKLVNTPRDCLVVMVQGDESEPEERSAHNKKEWMQPWVLCCHVVEIEDGDPFEKRVNTIRADVQKALMADVHRGGLAIRTILFPSEIFELSTGAAFTGVAVPIVIHYAVNQDDPNVSASI